jgi:hypothetical protein
MEEMEIVVESEEDGGCSEVPDDCGLVVKKK